MNLVQINERLKDMPLQVVQRYANGMSPEVPPYLALGELQRRETLQKQFATAKGAAQGPQPSIKEQIEQKAGLMALQQMQQQQAQQAAPQPGGPIPAGAPQPTPQPEAMEMAMGGLASLPVNSNMYNFDCGGIVAFSGEKNGSYVPDSDKEKEKKKLRHYTLMEQGADWQERLNAAREADPERPQRVERIRDFESSIANLLAGAGSQGVKEPAPVAAPPVANVAKQEEMPPPRLMDGRPNPAYVDYMRRKGPPVSSVYPDESKRGTAAGLPTIIADQKKPMADKVVPPRALVDKVVPEKNVTPPAAATVTNAATPAAAESTIPGLNDPSFMQAAKRALAEPDQDQLIQAEMARRKAFGIEGRGGEEQERRINQMMAEYEKEKESRGLERLMEVLGGRNLGEMGSRYLGYEGQRRAADRAQAMKMNELLGAIESGRRTEGIAGAKGIGEEIAKRGDRASQLAGQLGSQQMQSGVSLANQAAQNRTQLQIAELDRKLREKLHNTPAAQKLSIEEQAINDYVRTGMSRTEAFEKVKTISAGMKGEMTIDQARDNVRKDLENPVVGNKMQADAAGALKARGIANPTSLQIMDYLVEQQMKGSKRATGTTGSSNYPKDIQNILDQYPSKK